MCISSVYYTFSMISFLSSGIKYFVNSDNISKNISLDLPLSSIYLFLSALKDIININSTIS